jgi:glycosyltransferase involved in cell wall biosynthesis
MINFSIIVPHKNSLDLLNRCVSSIPKRDDLEVIVVDNNSSPEIVNFSNFLFNGNKNVYLIHDTISTGAGGARNTGLAKASGKWIMFVDCDDYLNYCANDVFSQFVDSKEDVIYFKTNSVDSDTYINDNRGLGVNDAIDKYIKGDERGANTLRYSLFCPWAKLIKHELLKRKGIHFEDTIVMNDVYFSYTLGHALSSMTVSDKAILCVTSRKNSVSKNHSVESYLERIRIKTTALSYYKNHGIPVSYLKDNNLLFYQEMLHKYPKCWKEGLRVMRNNGESLTDIVIGFFFKLPLRRLINALKL